MYNLRFITVRFVDGPGKGKTGMYWLDDENVVWHAGYLYEVSEDGTATMRKENNVTV